MSTAPAASAAAKATISVEYAKSGRSSCKVCSEGIAKGALRLGASARDPRGFDSTKWYHVACFPSSSHPIDPVEKVKGFDSIKTCKRDHTAVGTTEESSPKKVKASPGVAENVSISVEYAKSGRSTCKGCSESIAAAVSYFYFFSVETNCGFGGWAQNQDRDKLRELENCKRDGNVTDQLNEQNLKKEVVHSMEDSKGTGNNIEGVKDDGLQSSAKIAAFDFDGCLAKTSVIFTNESNIERWNKKRQQAVDSKIGRLDKFIERVKVPIQVFIACGLGKGKTFPDDPFRKPNTGMWWLMREHFNSGVTVDMDKSFYVGDAAGRENDHSDADKEFAKAIGLKFHVPEEYFGEAANI
ncbi:putative diphosphonucleotide phosphatase [Oryza sativa (japonica cultivar-group)]